MSGAHVFVDSSQFPENVRRDLMESLRTRLINHKFHYDSYKQAAKWLALHEAYSPARRDPSCLNVYDDAFRAALATVGKEAVHVVGLGCGGGQKEARLLQLLVSQTTQLSCTLSDVSLPLVLTARSAALDIISGERCAAVVCDLATTKDFASSWVDSVTKGVRRIVTLFGIVPNFEPRTLFPLLRAYLRPDDLLLLSANLVPTADYAIGVEGILPQYDNAPTRDWLMTLFFDLGFERGDGELNFTVETDSTDLRRITAFFRLKTSRELLVLGERFSFVAGDSFRVFFSYRHTPLTIRPLLSRHQLESLGEWLNETKEEGVFLCRRAADL